MLFLSCFPQTPTQNRRTVNSRMLTIIPEDGTNVSGSGLNQVNALCVRGSSPNASYLEFQCNVCVHVSLPDWNLHVSKCLSNKMFSTHCAESKALKTWFLPERTIHNFICERKIQSENLDMKGFSPLFHSTLGVFGVFWGFQQGARKLQEDMPSAVWLNEE